MCVGVCVGVCVCVNVCECVCVSGGCAYKVCLCTCVLYVYVWSNHTQNPQKMLTWSHNGHISHTCNMCTKVALIVNCYQFQYQIWVIFDCRH